VISGNAQILAYESLIDARSGDAIFVPARPLTTTTQTVTFPAVGHAEGIGGAVWDTELWYATPGTPATVAARLAFFAGESAAPSVEDFLPATHTAAVLPEVFGVHANSVGQMDATVPAGALIGARTYATGTGSGTVGDRVADAVAGIALDVLHVESSAAARTNIGIAALDRTLTTVRITLFDDAGRVLGTDSRLLGSRGSVQIPIGSLYSGAVTNGRVRFEVTSGGRVAAYASVVDNRTQDSVILPAE
jgi:hypothetical protein